VIIIYYLITLKNDIANESVIIGKQDQEQDQDQEQYQEQKYASNNSINHKPIMWVYWELVNGAIEPPAYISLCLDIMKRNASNTFNIKFLNEKSVFDYLPDLRSDINSLPIALKTDYIRVRLLTKYGGLWVDADTIIMTDLRELVEKLNQHVDYIGAGCTGPICLNQEGYGKPSNWLMGSIPNGKLITRCLNALNKKLDDYFSLPVDKRKEFDYYELGKIVIWEQYDKLIKDDLSYRMYHMPSYADGARDIKGKWVTLDIIFPNNIIYAYPEKLMICMLANGTYNGKDPKYNWFGKLSRKQILEGNYFVSQLFIKALNYDPINHLAQ
jgi:hypothetical protein